MNQTVKVIISPSYGQFMPNKRLEKLIRDRGHENWADIQARTDERLIAFVEKYMDAKQNGFGLSFVGDGKNHYLRIEQVDTSKPWVILNQDGAEQVHYVEIECIDPLLNFHRLVSGS